MPKVGDLAQAWRVGVPPALKHSISGKRATPAKTLGTLGNPCDNWIVVNVTNGSPMMVLVPDKSVEVLVLPNTVHLGMKLLQFVPSK